jgi:hypothetical protein
MLAHVLVLSAFGIGMAAVLLLSRMGPREQEQAQDEQEPQELRAAA